MSEEDKKEAMKRLKALQEADDEALARLAKEYVGELRLSTQ